MGTETSIVIAYRDMGCEYRRASYHYVKNWYEARDFDVVVESGDSDATFSRAAAINRAIERARGDVIVQSDPDSLVRMQQLMPAIQAAASTGRLAIPHDQYLYLRPDPTADILTGGRDVFDVSPDDCEQYGPNGSGNVVVFTREAWAEAGRFDERFGVWGGDDAAFRHAVDALYGLAHRIAGPMVHLWHPRLPQSEPGHPEYTRQLALLTQYCDAAEISPQAVIDLVRSRP